MNQSCLATSRIFRSTVVPVTSSRSLTKLNSSQLATFSILYHNRMTSYGEDDGLWEKPSWAKKGGATLKKTGFGDAMKKDGNLAAPITFTPFKNEDHTNYVANVNILNETEQGQRAKESGNLAMPITNIRDELRKQRGY